MVSLIDVRDVKQSDMSIGKAIMLRKKMRAYSGIDAVYQMIAQDDSSAASHVHVKGCCFCSVLDLDKLSFTLNHL